MTSTRTTVKVKVKKNENESASEIDGDIGHPWPNLESMFSYKGMGNSLKLQCLLCAPKITVLLANGNFHLLKKHVERVHRDKLDHYVYLAAQGWKEKVINIESEDTPPNKRKVIDIESEDTLPNLNKVMNIESGDTLPNKRRVMNIESKDTLPNKRKVMNIESEDTLPNKRRFMNIESEDTLPNTMPENVSSSCMHEPKSKVDGLIIDFITTGLHPFSIVETTGFCNLMNGIQPGYDMISRPTVSKRIEEAAMDVKKKLITAMSNTQYVATTTDCWTSRRCSYVGVTAHWIDASTFERHSAALACRQLKGTHTYNTLARTLDEIHSEYKIRNKVVRTTTDSGSNFFKAFRVYGEDRTRLQDIDDEQSDAEESDRESEITIQDTAGILCKKDEDTSTYAYRLPKHQRCACYLLNLVATVDVDVTKVESNDPYQKLFCSAFAKCQAIWNTVGRSSVTVEAECRIQLIRPNQTKWNSTFLAVKRILRIVREEDDAIGNVCASFKIEMLNHAELEFLKEYHAAMKPVAQSLNILESEKHTHMGWLLPTMYQLITKLEKIKNFADLSLPLVTGLLSAIRHRFADMLEDPELIAAAILLPKFKNTWTNQSSIINKGVEYIKMCLEKKSSDSEETFDTNSDDEDFFSSIKPSQPPALQLQKINRYLACQGPMEMLKSFPTVSEVSLQLNTPLPASAACEQLFSCMGPIFSPKRSRLDSQNFENQLLIKLNQKICQELC